MEGSNIRPPQAVAFFVPASGRDKNILSIL
jgi:hypothetical protein